MLVSPADQARKEIRSMVDAITSVVIREHAVDESFVINEIKAYISARDFAEQNESDSIHASKNWVVATLALF